MDPKKRSRSSPTGLTPSQQPKRRVQHIDRARRRKLFDDPTSTSPVISSSSVSSGTRDDRAGEGYRRVEVKKNPVYTRLFPRATGWSSKEDEALTEFVLLSTDGRAWPSIKSSRFWEGAAAFLMQRFGTKRTSEYDQTL